MRFSMKKMSSIVTMAAIVVSSSAFLKADAAATTISYVKYSYATRTTSDPYTLTHNDAASATQAYAVISPDERERDGYSGIVRLSCGGTGFIVDDHTIATAAHCVNAIHSTTSSILEKYEATDYFVYDLTVELYNDDGTPKNSAPLVPVEIHVPSSYLSASTSASKVSEDYALITVSEDLSELGCSQFDLGVPYSVNSTDFSNIDLFVTGIPQTVNGIDNSYNLVYTGKGAEHPSFSSSSIRLYYTADASGGNSGGPVYIATEYSVGSDTYVTYTAIAIHHGGSTDNYNVGAAINSSRIQFYLNNTNLSY